MGEELEKDYYAVIDKYQIQCDALAKKTDDVYRGFFGPMGLSREEIQILIGYVAFLVLEKSRGWGGIKDGNRKDQPNGNQNSGIEGSEVKA